MTETSPAYSEIATRDLRCRLYGDEPLTRKERDTLSGVLIAVESALDLGVEPDGEGTAPHFPAFALRHLRQSIARKFPVDSAPVSSDTKGGGTDV